MAVDVTVIAGTRPEAIKLAPVVLALRARGVNTRLVASGQHAELLGNALACFELQPDATATQMQPGLGLAALTSRLLAALEAELVGNAPRLVVVQGDTVTTLAGALAAFYRRIPCAHVEAGLRSGNREAPWPEELTRAAVDRLCTRLYAPTQGARQNLLAEGVKEADVLVTGQTGVDAALHVKACLPPLPPPAVAAARAGARPKLVFATGHRRENQDGGIGRVAATLRQLVDQRDDTTVVYAAHPSPDARRGLQGIAPHDHWRVIEALDYTATLWMLRVANCVVSDSGGLQEEAPCFGTPVLVTRDVTERPEGIAPGFLRLVGTQPEALRAALEDVLDDPGLRSRLAALPNPYGDGNAAARIADDITRILAGAAS